MPPITGNIVVAKRLPRRSREQAAQQSGGSGARAAHRGLEVLDEERERGRESEWENSGEYGKRNMQCGENLGRTLRECLPVIRKTKPKKMKGNAQTALCSECMLTYSWFSDTAWDRFFRSFKPARCGLGACREQQIETRSCACTRQQCANLSRICFSVSAVSTWSC